MFVINWFETSDIFAPSSKILSNIFFIGQRFSIMDFRWDSQWTFIEKFHTRLTLIHSHAKNPLMHEQKPSHCVGIRFSFEKIFLPFSLFSIIFNFFIHWRILKRKFHDERTNTWNLSCGLDLNDQRVVGKITFTRRQIPSHKILWHFALVFLFTCVLRLAQWVLY